MRPIELTLDGFRSYAGTATFNFEGRRLVGIVGPIGSGKSSILDAVAFALYGRTPRREAGTKAVINQRRGEARVALTFSVDGQRWKVVRALRRKGPSAHALYRLEDGREIEAIDREREVERRIESLLGLDWDGFRRSVLLAQYQFAGFLEATPGEKDAVLKGVFGFERLDGMRAAAKARLDAAAAQMGALDRLRGQAENDRRDLAVAVAERDTRAARLEAVAAVANRVAEADREWTEAGRQHAEAEAQMKRLAALGGQVPAAEEAAAVLGAATEAAGAVEAREGEARAAEAAAARAEASLRAALEAAGGRAAIDEATGLVALAAAEQRAADEADARAAKAHSEEQEAAAAEAAAAGVVGDAEKERAAALKHGEKAAAGREKAAAALHEAHRREAALSLRGTLEVGAPCPVCEQPIVRLPRGRKAAGVATAERALETAEATNRSAQARLTAAEADLARAREAAGAASRQRGRAAIEAEEALRAAARANEGLAATRRRLKELLGEGDAVALLSERRSAVAGAEAAAAEARRAAQESARESAEARRRAEEAKTGLHGLARRLAEVVGRLGADIEVSADPAVLRTVVERVGELWRSASREAEARGAAGSAAVRQAAERRTSLLAEAGLPADADPPGLRLEAERALAGVQGRITELQRRLGELALLEQEERETVARHALLQRLHADLAPAAFQKYVLDERRRDLAALGSEQFEALSGGRYRFSDDGEFAVVDLSAAEATRAAGSLSGGETFLASLGLALALAEMVTREGGRLDAFFLDEGFGSLDPEHLDLAMEGVERLVAGSDRLVVVVSHVAAMRERIEDLIVLGKDSLTGDTQVLAGATPGG